MTRGTGHIITAAAIGLMACGGEAVVDEVASGGHGGSTTTGTTTSTSTTSSGTTGTGAGTGPTCDVMQQDLEFWLGMAQACDPLINALQCTGQTVVYDTCGCEQVASDYNLEAAEAALTAYKLWVDAGCGPWDCYACPPGPDTPWYCDPGVSACLPAYE